MREHDVPDHVRYLVIGAGVHGLSTAYHLAIALEARGQGTGSDILIVDKTGVGGGASGIACGVIRNNYFQPAMRELMAHSVNIWESDPEAFHYHPVGYMQISPEVMQAGVTTIHEEQRAIGYDSELIEGEADCTRYMRTLFDDWQARGITSVLHEKKGGYANNQASMHGLADKAFAKGVRFCSGVTVTGFQTTGNAVTSVETDRGTLLATTWSSRWARGSSSSGTCWSSPRPSMSNRMARSARTSRCGPTGISRRERWGSIRGRSSPMTAQCRR
jgi:methylglutamate dehydrogenase subunit A